MPGASLIGSTSPCQICWPLRAPLNRTNDGASVLAAWRYRRKQVAGDRTVGFREQSAGGIEASRGLQRVADIHVDEIVARRQHVGRIGAQLWLDSSVRRCSDRLLVAFSAFHLAHRNSIAPLESSRGIDPPWNTSIAIRRPGRILLSGRMAIDVRRFTGPNTVSTCSNRALIRRLPPLE